MKAHTTRLFAPSWTLAIFLAVAWLSGQLSPPGMARANPPSKEIGVSLDPILYLPLVIRQQCSPTIHLTHVPDCGSTENLRGKVSCALPSEYKVAVYIFVSGWYNKPYWASPSTPIKSDGTWITDITTGKNDAYATQIAAFLIPISYSPPLMHGEPILPAELYSNALSYAMITRTCSSKTIQFSGRTWNVKSSPVPVGPGPNYFSADPFNVWVDAAGRLHLKITHQGDRWLCSEVITTEPLGYGKYTFSLASRADLLDQNAVLGLFTWDDNAPEYNYRELDIEFSRWGAAGNENAQYVIQPWDHPGNLHRFPITLSAGVSTHSFDWQASQVDFASVQDSQPLQTWTYTGSDNPPPGNGNARINLWLMNGSPPSDGQEVEVIIQAFDFTP